MFQSKRLFKDKCTIAQESTTQSPTGQKLGSTPVAVEGLSNLSCRITALKGEEMPRDGKTQALSTHKIGFQTVHPIATAMRVHVPSGPFAGTYNITRAYADGSGYHTILEVLLVK